MQHTHTSAQGCAHTHPMVAAPDSTMTSGAEDAWSLWEDHMYLPEGWEKKKGGPRLWSIGGFAGQQGRRLHPPSRPESMPLLPVLRQPPNTPPTQEVAPSSSGAQASCITQKSGASLTSTRQGWVSRRSSVFPASLPLLQTFILYSLLTCCQEFPGYSLFHWQLQRVPEMFVQETSDRTNFLIPKWIIKHFNNGLGITICLALSSTPAAAKGNWGCKTV